MLNDRSYSGLKPPDIDNDTLEIARKFSSRPLMGTCHLGYRDLPEIFKKFTNGSEALDYGCGAGYSTNLLRSMGFNAVGTDISSNMLSLAKKNYPDIKFFQASIGKLPFSDSSFDLVLSVFVLFDLPSMDQLVNYLNEARRVLRPNGVFVATTGSEHFHQNHWKTARIINGPSKAGDIYSVKILDADIVFNDFFYTDDMYVNAFNKAGMKVLKRYYPLGKPSDGIEWETEYDVAPFVIYVAK